MVLAENKTVKKNGVGKVLELFREKPLLTAFLMNLFAFLIRILTMDIKYEVSDDHMQDALLSGAFGQGYDPHMLFSSPFLGYILKFFYQLIPTVSFYFLFIELLCFVSLTAILYVSLLKNRGFLGFVFGVIFLLSASDDMYVLLQFTRAAAVAGIAGGLLVLYGYFDAKKGKILFIISGTVITVLGFLLRVGSINISIIFLGLVFLYRSFLCYKESEMSSKEKKKKILVGFAICLALVGMLFGLNFLGNLVNNRDSKYKEFYDYQQYRFPITDTWVPQYDEVKDGYSSLGYDELDYYMLNSWEFVDTSIYPNENLEQIGKINGSVSDNLTKSILFSLGDLIARGTIICWGMLCLYVLVLFSALNGKNLIWPFIVLLSVFSIFIALIYFGRINYRVESGIIICANAAVMSTFEICDDNKFRKSKFSIFKRDLKITEVLVSIAALILVAVHFPLYIPDSYQMSLSDEDYRDYFNQTMQESGDYSRKKYGFRTADRKPHPNILGYIASDTEHFYYVDLYTGIQSFYFDYEPWIRPRAGLYLDDYFYFGSVAMHHPGEKYVLEQHGIDPENPFSGLANEDIYIVDNEFIDIKLDYVKRYYEPEATVELVNVVDGYSIWKMSVPRNE